MAMHHSTLTVRFILVTIFVHEGQNGADRLTRPPY